MYHVMYTEKVNKIRSLVKLVYDASKTHPAAFDDLTVKDSFVLSENSLFVPDRLIGFDSKNDVYDPALDAAVVKIIEYRLIDTREFLLGKKASEIKICDMDINIIHFEYKETGILFIPMCDVIDMEWPHKYVPCDVSLYEK